jgi:hypothetical protein
MSVAKTKWSGSSNWMRGMGWIEVREQRLIVPCVSPRTRA